MAGTLFRGIYAQSGQKSSDIFVFGDYLFLVAVNFFRVECYAATETMDYSVLNTKELGELISPIALYPDQLLQVILPSSTFPDQIVDAGLLIKTPEDAKQIEAQAWDGSVKVLATYPGVLSMMFQKIDWTTNLGRAFLYQNEDLLDAIQDKRSKAQSLGNLKSNEQQTVSTTTTPSGDTVIVVQPANPEVVYVPQSTTTVYTEPSSSSDTSALVPIVSFGLGMAVGAVMSDDDDDHYYYGGGYGGMWNNDNVDQWQDNRRAAWEDYNDRAWDKQEHRQEMAKDRQDFRQDSYKDGTWSPNAANRDQAKQQAQTRRDNYAKNNPQAANRAESRSQPADVQAKRDQAKAAMNSRGYSSGKHPTSAQQPQNRPSSSNVAFGNYGGRSSTQSASSRGAASRGTFGSSGGSYSGGGGRSFSGGGGRSGGGRRR